MGNLLEQRASTVAVKLHRDAGVVDCMIVLRSSWFTGTEVGEISAWLGVLGGTEPRRPYQAHLHLCIRVNNSIKCGKIRDCRTLRTLQNNTNVAIQLYCFRSVLARMYGAGLLFGFAEDSTHGLAGNFIRKQAVSRTAVNEWAPLLPYHATFGPNQTAAEESTLEFGSLPIDRATASINASRLPHLYHRQDIATMTFEYTKLPQEEDLPPDNTHCTKCGATLPNPPGKAFYCISIEIY